MALLSKEMISRCGATPPNGGERGVVATLTKAIDRFVLLVRAICGLGSAIEKLVRLIDKLPPG